MLLRLIGKGETPSFENTRHWFATAARLMRQVLIDRARAAQRDKRGGGAVRVALVDEVGLPIEIDTDLIDLDRVLVALAAENARIASIVELRCFVRLEVAEMATLLELDERTVYRDWALARAWLQRRMTHA